MTETPPRKPAEDSLLDHEVDGIREYDNPLPRWWINIFYVTIAFSVIYALNFIPGVGSGPGRIANYEDEMAAAKGARDAAAANSAPITPEAILAVAGDPAGLAKGKERFRATCAPCHREDGGGSIGPNLTDDFWLHGGQVSQIFTTVNDGVVAKGMPAWGQVLKPEEITAVTAYVTTLRGTNPANAKAPQGDRAVAESAPAAVPGSADSVQAAP